MPALSTSAEKRKHWAENGKKEESVLIRFAESVRAILDD
jgi:hypothetical protein